MIQCGGYSSFLWIERSKFRCKKQCRISSNNHNPFRESTFWEMYELMNSWRGFRQFLIFKILGGDFFNIFSVGWNHLRSVKVFHYITTLPSNNCLYHAIPTYLALDPSFQRVSSFAQNRLVSFRTPTCAIDCHGLKLPQTVARRRCYPLNVSHPNRLIQQGPPHLPHFFLGGDVDDTWTGRWQVERFLRSRPVVCRLTDARPKRPSKKV